MPIIDSIQQASEPLRLRYHDSPLPDWLRAAGEALLGLLPLPLRQQLGAQQRCLLLVLDGDQLQLHSLVGNQTQAIGAVSLAETELLELLRIQLDADSGAVPRWLLLDTWQVLRPVLTLPLSAESRLREVLAHEIDRQTPFSADQVSYQSRILSRDIANRQLRVELVVLAKQRLDTALSALGPMAPGLAGVDVRDEQGAQLGINLLPTTQRSARADRSRNLNLGLSAITVLALFMALLFILQNRRAVLEQVSQRTAAANIEVRQVRKLRNALDNSLQAANFLAKHRAQQPTMLELLADLTHRIPDDTALEKLSVDDGELVLSGVSQQAPALIGLLQDSHLIKNPALAGAVQTDPRTRKDRFTLTATIAGSAKEQADAADRRNP